jgi:hypothetical protein
MSKSVEKASEKALDEPQSDSVYDFLYCDSRRIASFLAQFDDSGHLEKVIQRESAATGSKRGWKFGLGGGGMVVGTGGTGNASFEISPAAGGSEASERVYDPLWTNARTFLDYLEGASLLQRNLLEARIGQFALLSGALGFFDLSLLKSAWEQPFVRGLLKAGMNLAQPPIPVASRQQQRRAGGGKSHAVTEQQHGPADAVLGMLQFLPHAIVASVRFEHGSVWCNLNSASLVGSSSDIILKHGVSVPGVWNVVGIVDAFPETESDDVISAAQAAIAAGALGSLGEVMATFAPAVRNMLGRPKGAWGVTPLLIFREISA